MADLTNNPTPDEDFRVSLARELLAESKAAESVDPARWWGRLESALEMLLSYVDEQVAR